ncbi:MAG TPA: phospholipase D-like domain-containing protein [Acidimicrobiales bacterium]|nr:phospholipase D-like domain-containing protein [Acidimicrobiales bacterium]
MGLPTRSWLKVLPVAAGAGLAATYAYGTAKYHHAAQAGSDVGDAPAPGSPGFDRLVEVMTGAPVRDGNRVQILRNGAQTFPAMLEAIAGATTTVDLSSYIYWPGEITDRFTGALAARARAGVEVNVVVDAWGSAKLDRETVATLRDAGATFAYFRKPHWYSAHKLNNRMHRRLLIVDGRIGFAGGVGIADVWMGDGQDPEHWRETHVRIEGPAVRDILGGFAENWAEASRTVLGPAHAPKLAGFDDGVDVQVVRSSASSGGTAASQVFYAAIVGARERLWLMTAYFAPGPAFVDVLCEAADRGVDVRVIVNGPHVERRSCAARASAGTAGCSRPAYASSSTSRPCCTQRS